MLKSISMHKRDSYRIIESTFVTSYLTFRGSIATNSYQPQKQTRHHEKNLLYSHITSFNYLTKQVVLPLYVFSFLVVLGSLNYTIVLLLSHNNILDDATKGIEHNPKGFFCCFENNNKYHVKQTHTWRQTCKGPHQIESLIPNT